ATSGGRSGNRSSILGRPGTAGTSSFFGSSCFGSSFLGASFLGSSLGAGAGAVGTGAAFRPTPDSSTAADSSPAPTAGDHQRGLRFSRGDVFNNMVTLLNRSEECPSTPVAAAGAAGSATRRNRNSA